MQIHIHRTLTKGELTEGHLVIDNRTVCDTLENSQACLKTGRSYPLCLVILPQIHVILNGRAVEEQAISVFVVSLPTEKSNTYS